MNRKTIRSTTRTDCGHGGAIRRAGEVRASTPIRVLVAVIAALLAVTIFPVPAFANSSSVIWGPSVLPSQDIGIVVNAPDRYRAAAVALGHTDAEISSWSDDVLAKLSNQSTGGSFYTFAQKFGEVDDAVGSDNPLSAVISAVGNSFWAIAETLYGDEIWLAGYSATEFESAANDLASIINGGNVGGGGSGDDGEYFVYNFKPKGAYFHDVTKLYVPKDSFSYAAGWGDTLPVSGYLGFLSSSPTTLSFTSVGFFNDASATYALDKTGTYYASLSVTNAYGYHGSIASVTMNVEQVGTSLYVRSVSRKIYVYYNDEGTKSLSIIAKGGDGTAVFNGETSGGGGEPVTPPTNWPEDPSAPTPPELPEPGTNPTVTPTPWSPVVSPSFDLDLNITADPTSTDLLDWVQKIYYELKAFHTDAHDWFVDITLGFDGVTQAINHADHQIYSQLLVIDDTLRTEGLKIRNYMYQMFHWLAQQFEFQNDSFNDSNIVYWLKRIWSKLGNGDVNVRPTDPTVDPPAWWEWLNKMLDSLLDGLVGVFNELLGGTGDLLEEVIHQFPFSIPWDIAAFLTALAAPPVTPVFDIVIPAVDSWWPEYTIHVDMSPYDTAAATVRLMTKLVFAGLLAWKSRELLDMMDVTKW